MSPGLASAKKPGESPLLWFPPLTHILAVDEAAAVIISLSRIFHRSVYLAVCLSINEDWKTEE